ncbi:hypothetical protein ASF76_02225 [Microbacterium sp. Leaf151]|nr:hypothetical protein ASF76_02225 [Microbacterium sp. Leaf151]
MTKEHILRNKFNKTFDGKVGPKVLTVSHRGEDGQTERDIESRGLPYGSTVKVVCADCNNGWMNDLENEVESDLLRLIGGQYLEFTPEQRNTLARWTTKTALMRQFQNDPSVQLQPHSPVFQAAMSGHPTGSWTYAAPIYWTEHPWMRSVRIRTVATTAGGSDLDMLLTTIQVRRLLLQSVVSLDDVTAQYVDATLAPLTFPRFARVHPTGDPIDWARTPVLNAQEFFSASEKFAQVLMDDMDSPLKPFFDSDMR